MAVVVVTPPAVEPLTLAEAKTHLRVDGSEEDAYITGLIVTAREFCEKWQRRAHVTQTLEYSLNAFPAERRIELPKPPLQSVVSVKYTDENEVEYTFAPTNYVVDSRSKFGAVVLKALATWPSVALTPVNGVIIRYIAGYGAPASVPSTTKQAMRLLIGHWFVNREAVLTGTISKEIEFAVRSLLGQNRCY